MTNRLRVYLVAILSVLMLAYTIQVSWSGNRVSSRAAAASNQGASGLDVFENKLLLFQSKVIIGSLDYFQSRGGASTAAMQDMVRSNFAQSLNPNMSPETRGVIPPPSQKLLLRKMIIAAYLNLDEQESALRNAITSGNDDGSINPTVRVLALSALGKENTAEHWLSSLQQQKPDSGSSVFAPDEVSLLHSELDFFADILIAHVEPLADRKPALQRVVLGQCTTVFHFVVIACLGILIFGTLSIGSFITILVLYVRKRFHFRYQSFESIRPLLLYETFVLYLLGMTLMPDVIYALRDRGFVFNPLKTNIYAILAMLVVTLWPLLWGAPFREWRETIWGTIRPGGKLLADIVLGPLVYIASWSVFFFVLIFYSLLLYKFGVSPEQGAHPIMPILISADRSARLLVIVLAVGVAPIVEETMFRGVLYGWLRKYWGAKTSAVVSALLFASVHPQGVVGIIPLAFIGMVLAFLREWRGSVVAPMLAHACFNAGTIILVLAFLS